METNLKFKGGLIFFILIIVLSSVPFSFAGVQEDIAERNRQIEELRRQIEQYEQEIAGVRGKSRTLENEISKLNAEINKANLEIRSLQLSINQTSAEINTTEGKIFDAQTKMDKHKEALAKYLKIAYEKDNETLTSVLLKNDNLSDFFNEIHSLKVTQDSLRIGIQELKETKLSLETYQSELEDKQTELERSRYLEELEKKSLDGTKKEKDQILKTTKGQEAKFQELVNQSKRDIEALRTQVTYLQQNGVSAEDAVKYGELAAIRTGIRPAYLIAVLEVESGLGRNVGKCNRAEDPPSKKYTAIMKPTRDIEPFLKITSELGLDPNSTAVSCPQYVNGVRYGWGGAMGPAQFIPSTWMGYRDEVSRIVGRSANPWNIEDAFVAAAVKLARVGATAQTRAAEIAASKAYYSGNSKCSTAPCNSYANAIQRKAEEIARNL